MSKNNNEIRYVNKYETIAVGNRQTGRETGWGYTSNRRRFLGALGMGTVGAAAGCIGVSDDSEAGTDGGDDAGGDDGDGEDGAGGGGDDGTADDDGEPDQQPSIHPSFGYPGTAEDDIPDPLSPDHTVELHIDEELFIMENERPVGVQTGAFHFDPVGLHIEPGDIVEFQLESPDHTVTSLHPGFGRQQRVPDGVPWFSSPIIAKDGFWLYRFDQPGVYDVVCAPHELLGMAMRIVVGDKTEPVVRSEGRPPDVLAAVLIGTGIPDENGEPDLGVPPLAPQNIVDQGSVNQEDIDINLAVPIPMPTDPSNI